MELGVEWEGCLRWRVYLEPRHHPGINMIVHVTVKHPYAGVIGDEIKCSGCRGEDFRNINTVSVME